MALRLEAVVPSRSPMQLNRSLDFRRTYCRSRDWRRHSHTLHRHQGHTSDFSLSQRRQRVRVVAAGFNDSPRSMGSGSMGSGSMGSGSHPFMTLGLQPASNPGLKDIKSAYRTLAIQYHPDLNNSPDATEKFLEIREAYEAALSSVKSHPHHNTRPPQSSRTQKKPKSRGRDDLADIFGDWV